MRDIASGEAPEAGFRLMQNNHLAFMCPLCWKLEQSSRMEFGRGEITLKLISETNFNYIFIYIIFTHLVTIYVQRYNV